MHALKERGMPVDVTAITMEEARESIVHALAQQKQDITARSIGKGTP
jgi:hypothetical protein